MLQTRKVALHANRRVVTNFDIAETEVLVFRPHIQRQVRLHTPPLLLSFSPLRPFLSLSLSLVSLVRALSQFENRSVLNDRFSRIFHQDTRFSPVSKDIIRIYLREHLFNRELNEITSTCE